MVSCKSGLLVKMWDIGPGKAKWFHLATTAVCKVQDGQVFPGFAASQWRMAVETFMHRPARSSEIFT